MGSSRFRNAPSGRRPRRAHGPGQTRVSAGAVCAVAWLAFMVGQLPSCTLQDLSHLEEGGTAQGGTGPQGGKSGGTGGAPPLTGGGGNAAMAIGNASGEAGAGEGATGGAGGEPPASGGEYGEGGQAGAPEPGGDGGAPEGGAPSEGGAAGVVGAEGGAPPEGGAAGADGTPEGGTSGQGGSGGTAGMDGTGGSYKLGAEVVTNGGFEDGLDGWGQFGNATMEVIDEGCYEGMHCLACTSRDANWAGPAQTLTGLVRPGARYLFSAMLRTNDSSPHQFKVTAKVYCEEDDMPYYDEIVVKSARDEWVLFEGQVVARNCPHADFSFYVEQGTQTAPFPDIFLDGVSMREIVED